MFIDLSGFSGTKYETLSDFVTGSTELAISLSALFAVIMLVVAGFRYMLSFGDSKKIEAANRSMIFSIVGLVLVFVAPTVIEFIINQILNIK